MKNFLFLVIFLLVGVSLAQPSVCWMVWTGESPARLSELTGRTPAELAAWNGGLDFLFGQEILVCPPWEAEAQRVVDSLESEFQSTQMVLEAWVQEGLDRQSRGIETLQEQLELLAESLNSARAELVEMRRADSLARVRAEKVKEQQQGAAQGASRVRFSFETRYFEISKRIEISPGVVSQVRGELLLGDSGWFVAGRGVFEQGLGTHDFFHQEVVASGGGSLGFRTRTSRVEMGATGGATLASYRQPFSVVLFGEGSSLSRGGFGAAIGLQIHLDETERLSFSSQVSQRLWRDRTREIELALGASYEYYTQKLVVGDALQDHRLALLGQVDLWRFSLAGRAGASLARGYSELYGRVDVKIVFGEE